MRVLMAGGGTAGHVNPALAIADYIKQENPDSDIRFCGTDNGIENQLVPKKGYKIYNIDIQGLSRKFSLSSVKKNVRAVKKAVLSVGAAKKIIADFRPDCVLGAGGYASFPTVYAAQKMGVPTVILEVNAFAGITSKILSKKAKKVFICFDESRKFFKNSDKIILTGAPVRREICLTGRKESRAKLGLSDNDKLVVSFWGSVGALYMNKNMVDYIQAYVKEEGFYHIHAMGKSAQQWMPDEIKRRGINLGEHKKFDLRTYIYDMDVVMQAADLVVCRAGAATISELCCAKKPSLIVPSPHVAENHQEKNARVLEDQGAAVVMLEDQCSGAKLYGAVKNVISDEERLRSMAQNASKIALTGSVADIYDNIVSVVKQGK